MPARKVLEDRATNRQIQEMMHAMDTSQASNRKETSGEISALKDLITALSHQMAQNTGELTATRSELTATRNELTATRNELTATRNELTATKNELTATKMELTVTRNDLITTWKRSRQKWKQRFIPNYPTFKYLRARRHPTRRLLVHHQQVNQVTFRPSPRGA
jgi:septal ring factor EnvC (AmiA/AmiB activator)